MYNYDGKVYPTDESRMLAAMGDDAFCLGDVQTNTYEELFGGPQLRALVAGHPMLEKIAKQTCELVNQAVLQTAAQQAMREDLADLKQLYQLTNPAAAVKHSPS